jgi:hypothetical protein
MEHVDNVREKHGYGYLVQPWKTETGYEYSGGQMLVAWVSVNSTVTYAENDKQAVYDRYEAVVTKYKGTFPTLFQSCPMYSWMTTETYLILSVVQAVVISIVFCAIVLVIMTGNWRIGLSGL